MFKINSNNFVKKIKISHASFSLLFTICKALSYFKSYTVNATANDCNFSLLYKNFQEINGATCGFLQTS